MTGAHTMNTRWIARFCSAGLTVALAAGCGGQKNATWQRPKVVPAGGVVRFRGQPLDGALVTFVSQTVSASGRTDAEGRFTLTTFEAGDGAVPGKHTVCVSKVQLPDSAPDKSAAPVWRPGRTPRSSEPRQLIPKRYADPATSGLTADVAEGGNTGIVITITDTR